jgi:hypothetical protein
VPAGPAGAGDWLDDVSVLLQQVPGLCEGSPDRGAAGAQEAGEGVFGQGQAQVERSGHDAVGEGERPTGAGLVPGVAGGMVARPFLALGLPQGGEWNLSSLNEAPSGGSY